MTNPVESLTPEQAHQIRLALSLAQFCLQSEIYPARNPEEDKWRRRVFPEWRLKALNDLREAIKVLYPPIEITVLDIARDKLAAKREDDPK
jgi:hypothetical protein